MRFSDLSKTSGNCGRIISRFWAYINDISGDDPKGLLEHVLNSPRGRSIFNSIDKSKFNELLNSIRMIHSRLPINQKHIVLASVSNCKELSREKLKKEFRYKFGNTQYKSARRLFKKPKKRVKKTSYGPGEDYFDFPENTKWENLHKEQVGKLKRRKLNPPNEKKRKRDEISSSENYCYCHGSDDGTQMIQCDNCDEWFHEHCIDHKVDLDAPFYCLNCEEFEGAPKIQKISKYQDSVKDKKKKKTVKIQKDKSKKKTNVKKNKDDKKKDKKQLDLNKERPRGIVRKHNTCYIVSTLQFLLCQEQIRNEIINSSAFLEDFADEPDELFSSLQQVAREYTKSFKSLNIKSFVKVVEKVSSIELNEPFTAQRENDPREFFFFLLKHFPDSLKNFFTIQLAQQVTCENFPTCPSRDLAYEESYLPILTEEGSRLDFLINKYHQAYTDNDPDSGCPVCDSRKLTIQRKLLSGSEYMIISLARFISDASTNFQEKKTTHQVQLQDTLYFGDDLYKLVAEIVHHGESTKTGHYTANIKYSKDQKWYNANDSKIKENRKQDEENNYILMFEKIDMKGSEDEEEKEYDFSSFKQQNDETSDSESQNKEKKKQPVNWKFGQDVDQTVIEQCQLLSLQKHQQDLEKTDFRKVENKDFNEKLNESRKLFEEQESIAPTSNWNFISFKLKVFKKFQKWKKKFNKDKEDEFCIYQHNITVKDFERIQGTTWLNDNLINSYINFLLKNYQDSGFLDSHFPTNYADKVSKNNETKIEKMKNKIKTKIQECKNYIFIPIHLDQNHWALLLIDNTKKKVTFIDPLSENRNLTEFQVCLQQEIVPNYDFEYLTGTQKDGYNCGVYVLFYVACILTNIPIKEFLTCEQKIVEQFRVVMAYDIYQFRKEEPQQENDPSDSSEIVESQQGGGFVLEEMNIVQDDEDIDILEDSDNETETIEEQDSSTFEEQESYTFEETPEINIVDGNSEEEYQCLKSYWEAEQGQYHHEIIYVCPTCKYETPDKSNMTKHIRGEKKEKPYECEFPHCQKRFADSSNRNTHMKNVHHHIKPKKNNKGRPKLQKKIKKEINKFLSTHSSQGPATVDGKRVRFIEYNWAHCFKQFQKSSKSKISPPTFRKYADKKFRKAKRKTDLCPNCEKKKMLEKKLNKSTVKDREKIQAEIHVVNQHLERAKHQRNCFNKNISNLKEREAVLVVDFKQNVELGGSKREISKIFFQKQQRTVLGFVLYFRRNNKIEKKKIAFISEVLNHDTWIVTRALNRLLKLRIFPEVDTLKLWSDGGPHFRSLEFLRFIKDIPTITKKVNKVECSYFIEYHGKNPCDSYFSQISKMMLDHEMQNNGPLRSTGELLICLQDEIKRLEKTNEMYVFELTLVDATRNTTMDQLCLTRPQLRPKEKTEKKKKEKRIDFKFTDCYNFKFLKKNIVQGRVLNEEKTYVLWKGRDKSVTETRKNKINSKSPPSVNESLFSIQYYQKEERRNFLTQKKIGTEQLKLISPSKHGLMDSFAVEEQIQDMKAKIQKLEISLRKLETKKQNLLLVSKKPAQKT